LEPINLAIANI